MSFSPSLSLSLSICFSHPPLETVRWKSSLSAVQVFSAVLAWIAESKQVDSAISVSQLTMCQASSGRRGNAHLSARSATTRMKDVTFARALRGAPLLPKSCGDFISFLAVLAYPDGIWHASLETGLAWHFLGRGRAAYYAALTVWLPTPQCPGLPCSFGAVSLAVCRSADGCGFSSPAFGLRCAS